MKSIRLLSFIVILTTILMGCSKDNQKLKELTSKKEGQYALYVVGDELDGSEFVDQLQLASHKFLLIFNKIAL